MIEAVFFDVGDVLEVNPRTGWQERWAARLNLPVAEFERRREKIWAPGAAGKVSLDDIESGTAAAFALDGARLQALMDDAWSEYVGTLNRELAEYFTRLRPRLRTGILSNSFVGAREREEHVHGLSALCDVIIYSHEVGYLKPDPEIYRIACDRLGVRPEHAVLLDDLEENVNGARAIGMRAVVFRTNDQAVAELEALFEE